MLRGSIAWDWYVFHNLSLSNRPVRTRMPGGGVGQRSIKAVPYADWAQISLTCFAELTARFLGARGE